ncbi:MAG: hypothetical protein IJJ23_09570 [Clostridia bacterium]|nr:hypothetical protein [Clostridia bacterium]
MGEKVYVSVLATFDREGKVKPMRLRWTDGRTYDIDRVLEVRPAPSLKAGGQGQRYTVRIQGKERFLFLEGTPEGIQGRLRWFVEGRA